MKRPLVVAASALLALATEARAEPTATATDGCTAAAESAQVLRNSGKLVQAKEQLTVCMKQCPDFVKNDCGSWLNDVEARLASIVVRAKDPSGREVTDVRVSVDGNVVATRLEALALPVDPGVRHFTFDRAGSPTIEQDVTVREGEKARALDVRFSEASQAQSATPIVPIVLGGVGLASLAVFGIYHFSAKGDLDAMRGTCAPRCSRDAVDDVDAKIFVSNVALGVGITALAAGAFVYFFGGTSGTARTGFARYPLVVRF